MNHHIAPQVQVEFEKYQSLPGVLEELPSARPLSFQDDLLGFPSAPRFVVLEEISVCCVIGKR